MDTRLVKLQAALSAFIFLTLAGCGGGGGGGSTALLINTDWTHHTTGAIIGQSETISLFKTNGVLLRSASMNQDLPGVQQISIANIPAGTYHLEIDLWSGRDGTGSKTGELDVLVTVSGKTTFADTVGDDVTSIKVTPPSATVQIPHSQQFYATGYAATNVATFVAPTNPFSRQALGGVGSVSADGLFSATTQGSGSVIATHTASSLQGAATVAVPPFQTTTSKWTIIVYMNASNNLVQFSPLNFNQMETVAANPDVRFVVQWKESNVVAGSTFNSTRRYLVKPDNTSAIASELVEDMGPGIDMGDKQTLNDFISWSKTNFPATRYAVVIWNHGNGWLRSNSPITRGVSYDDETGNSIKTWELAQALGSNHFDILAWDASLMQMAEVDYEIKDQVSYIVGSEESPPGAGYPYDLVFAKFRDNPNGSTVTLSKAFVDGMITTYGDSTFNITQSVIDTSKLSALATASSNLADAMTANKVALTPFITGVTGVRAQTQSYSDINGYRKYVDIWDVCDRLQIQANIPAVNTACASLKTALTDAVVWEGHNVHSPGSHGLAIDFEDAASFHTVRGGSTSGTDYALLRWSSDTTWDEWLNIAP